MKIIKQKFVLDSSGSMLSQQETIISGFNEQLDSMVSEEKEQNVRYLVSLTTFNTTATVVFKDLPLSQVPKLTKQTYKPDGWTALYDAIGMSIDSAKLGESDTIVTVFTDGQENRSRTWKKAGIKALIDIRQQENRWGFVYFGSNQDAWAEAASINIMNAVNYTPTSTGSAISAMSICRSSYTMSANSNTYDINNLTACINKEDLLK